MPFTFLLRKRSLPPPVMTLFKTYGTTNLKRKTEKQKTAQRVSISEGLRKDVINYSAFEK